MTSITLIPIVLFVATLTALLYLRYRDYASSTKEEKAQLPDWSKVDRVKDGAASGVSEATTTLNEIMPALISLAVLVSSLYIILSVSYGDTEKKWAYGSVGMILGYWLRGK